MTPSPAPNPADVLVTTSDANGNPTTQWTGPGTANPQTGEVAGANPGLTQLAQYMGMSTAQTQAWINSSAAATQTPPPVIPPVPPAAIPVAAPVTAPAPVTPAQQIAAAAVNYASYEVPGNFYYTADIELVTNLMSQYGDTWDNPQAIVNNLYTMGTVPGTVTQALALTQMTGLAAATTATTAATTFALSSIPWYGWAAGGVVALMLFGGGGKK
jgi:hypothetical protein